jgi:hypothetical protein
MVVRGDTLTLLLNKTLSVIELRGQKTLGLLSKTGVESPADLKKEFRNE